MTVREGAAFAPPTRPTLTRPRLLESLRPVDTRGLALLVAPVGFGKTALLRQWSQTRGGPVRWCDPADLPTPEALLRGGAGRARLCGVIVDDIPVRPEPEVEDRLRALVQGVAPTLPVLLGTRRLPDLDLVRHEFPSATIVTERDLTFRPWETTALFADVYDDPLPEEAPLLLDEQTGGWPAILHLWHLARRMSGPGEHPAALDELVRQYLHREVLPRRTDPDLHRLLRATSVFDTITAERMDLLLDARHSHRMLTRIARRVDLVRVEAHPVDGATYTCQPVLRRHLRSELLHKLGPAGLRELDDRAAAVAERLGDLEEAFAARCRAQNAPAAGALLAQHGQSIVPASGRMLPVLTPRLAQAHPHLRLARARLLLADGRTREAHHDATLALPHLAGQVADECRAVADRAGAAASPVTPVAQSDSAECLRLLAQGRHRLARATLARAALPGTPEESSRIAADLALEGVCALVAPTAPTDEFDRVYDEICRHGLRWLHRLAYAVALCRGADPRRCAEARSLAAARELIGDAWGTALIETAVAAALVRDGRPDIRLLERLADRFRLLGSPPLEAWARSALALALSAGDLPDRDAAPLAEGFARSVGAPGPLALAYAARGLVEPRRRDEWLGLAQTTARTAGLGARPWTWGRDAASHRPGPGQQAAARVRSVSEPAPWGGLSLACFGKFTVTCQGRPATLRVRPVALTVLRILAIHAGSPVHRDLIIEAQWSALPAAAAQHNLHVAVSSLRQGLAAIIPDRSRQLLARQGQGYVLGPGENAITDLQRFDLRLAEATRARRAGAGTDQVAALRAAIDLYTDDVLPGDGPAEWVVAIREGYRLAAAEAAGRLAELELGREHTDAAIEAAQRSVQIDPFRDAAWRTLISAHLRAGDPAMAESARQEYAAVLASLGIRAMPRGGAHDGEARIRPA